jgi:uncharacterized protein YqjF (DUF2071 family)
MRARFTPPAAILADAGHRPWPLPRGPWRGFMRWSSLAFLHWPVPADALRPHLPPELELDTFDGRAWIGVVPFRMEGVRHRGLPPVPTAADFAEVNVRTYVRGGGRAGVWFFSLDAASRLAVRGARWGLGLPYFDAAMRMRRDGDAVDYRSVRTHRGAPAAELRARYRPAGEPYHAAPGTLDHWLTERYRLFGRRRSGRVYGIDVHHAPWPLQRAEVEIERNTMAAASGIHLPDAPPLAHFASPVDVLAWGAEPV